MQEKTLVRHNKLPFDVGAYIFVLLKILGFVGASKRSTNQLLSFPLYLTTPTTVHLCTRKRLYGRVEKTEVDLCYACWPLCTYQTFAPPPPCGQGSGIGGDLIYREIYVPYVWAKSF